MKHNYLSIGAGIGAILLISFLLYSPFLLPAEGNQSNDISQQTIKEKGGTVFERYSSSLEASAQFINSFGEPIGQAHLREGTNGVLIDLELDNLPAGEHAIHIHEKGDCSPVNVKNLQTSDISNFSHAGSHLSPEDNKHGFFHEEGPHAGDLLNIFANTDKQVRAHLMNDRVTLKQNNAGYAYLLDADGSAFIVHDGPDDYYSQKTGMAGARIACAVIKAE